MNRCFVYSLCFGFISIGSDGDSSSPGGWRGAHASTSTPEQRLDHRRCSSAPALLHPLPLRRAMSVPQQRMVTFEKPITQQLRPAREPRSFFPRQGGSELATPPLAWTPRSCAAVPSSPSSVSVLSPPLQSLPSTPQCHQYHSLLPPSPASSTLSTPVANVNQASPHHLVRAAPSAQSLGGLLLLFFRFYAGNAPGTLILDH
jgi:hypothetical protein